MRKKKLNKKKVLRKKSIFENNNDICVKMEKKKNNMAKIFGLSILGVIGYYLYSAYLTSKLLITISNIKIYSVTWQEMVITIDLNVQNPNDTTVDINQLNGYLEYNGQSIAVIDYNKSLTCAGNNAITPINDIKLTVQNSTLLMDVLTMISNNTWKNPEVTIKGKVVTNNNKIPFSIKTTLPVGTAVNSIKATLNSSVDLGKKIWKGILNIF